MTLEEVIKKLEDELKSIKLEFAGQSDPFQIGFLHGRYQAISACLLCLGWVE